MGFRWTKRVYSFASIGVQRCHRIAVHVWFVTQIDIGLGQRMVPTSSAAQQISHPILSWYQVWSVCPGQWTRTRRDHQAGNKTRTKWGASATLALHRRSCHIFGVGACLYVCDRIDNRHANMQQQWRRRSFFVPRLSPSMCKKSLKSFCPRCLTCPWPYPKCRVWMNPSLNINHELRSHPHWNN